MTDIVVNKKRISKAIYYILDFSYLWQHTDVFKGKGMPWKRKTSHSLSAAKL